MVKSFWPLKNNQSLIDAIKKHNIRNKALSIATLCEKMSKIEIL